MVNPDCKDCTESLWCESCAQFSWCDQCDSGHVVLATDRPTGTECSRCGERVCKDCYPEDGDCCARCRIDIEWVDGPGSEAKKAARSGVKPARTE